MAVPQDISQELLDRANFLLQEQASALLLAGSDARTGRFQRRRPALEIPDRLVLERWLGGPDGYLLCLYDNETGQWLLGTGYLVDGVFTAEQRIGDNFARRCV